MIPFFSTTTVRRAVADALGGGDLSPFIGFPVSAGLYYLFSRSIDVAAEDRVAESQRDLLELEAEAQKALGTTEDEGALEEVGARSADGLAPAGDGVTIDRHPGA